MPFSLTLQMNSLAAYLSSGSGLVLGAILLGYIISVGVLHLLGVRLGWSKWLATWISAMFWGGFVFQAIFHLIIFSPGDPGGWGMTSWVIFGVPLCIVIAAFGKGIFSGFVRSIKGADQIDGFRWIPAFSLLFLFLIPLVIQFPAFSREWVEKEAGKSLLDPETCKYVPAYEYNECITKIAVSRKSKSLCKSIEDRYALLSCLGSLAGVTNNADICPELEMIQSKMGDVDPQREIHHKGHTIVRLTKPEDDLASEQVLVARCYQKVDTADREAFCQRATKFAIPAAFAAARCYDRLGADFAFGPKNVTLPMWFLTPTSGYVERPNWKEIIAARPNPDIKDADGHDLHYYLEHGAYANRCQRFPECRDIIAPYLSGPVATGSLLGAGGAMGADGLPQVMPKKQNSENQK